MAAGVATLVAAAVAIAVAVPLGTTRPYYTQPVPYRAFEPNSWWNTPLPRQAPLDPHGAQILHYMRTAPESGKGCLVLAGAGNNNWGTPIYWARPSDPTYDVTGVTNGPWELHHLQIPVSAEPADNNDHSMTIYNVAKGYVVALTNARYHSWNDTWTASGGTVTYLDSNGLSAATGRSDDPRNRGTHRGNNGATMAVAYNEVAAGAVEHVLKVALGPEASSKFVFPMTGSDGGYDGDNPAVPPEGLRLRIKPSVNLEGLGLPAQALAIARALQRYGFYIGDSGGTTALKLENTRAEGRGQLWTISPDALCGLPFTSRYWDVIAPGYDPSR